MSDRGWMEPIVERVVGQVLETHTAQLQREIVRRVMEEIAAQAPPASTAPPTGAAELARSVAEIQIGSSQKEILRALLDSSSRYAARVALFVVKGSHATGWQARGFENGERVKDFALESTTPAVVRALSERVSATTPISAFDARFMETLGSPASGEARLLPLILKDKVAALVYADGGVSQTILDPDALEVLMLATSAWLEVNSLRKQAQKEMPAPADVQPPTSSEPAFNDPFAAHAPAFAMAAAASAQGSAPENVAAPEAVAGNESSSFDAGNQGAPVATQSAAAAAPAAEPLTAGQVQTEPVPTADAPGSTQDQEVHRKAQRFARLLVDEIKLYNQAKVSEGRKNKDLYDRLKDTIEKSRNTYQKRYGNTVAASGDYFQHELTRSLAEDDRSIMGPNFRA